MLLGLSFFHRSPHSLRFAACLSNQLGRSCSCVFFAFLAWGFCSRWPLPTKLDKNVTPEKRLGPSRQIHAISRSYAIEATSLTTHDCPTPSGRTGGGGDAGPEGGEEVNPKCGDGNRQTTGVLYAQKLHNQLLIMAVLHYTV